MSTKTQNAKIIFGLKVKQLRLAKKMSFAALAKETGMSVSYLNEIEKGKKYPKEDKIRVLAEMLGTSFDELISTNLTKNLAPVSILLKSNFLNELPLDLFGIELSKVVEIIANAPLRVGAFISTLLDISRNYALREENFYFAALRAYQEMHNNYFEEIEEATDKFIKKYKLPVGGPVSVGSLAKILKEEYGYKITENGLKDYPDLSNLRALFIPKKKKLLLNEDLTDMQKAFHFGKELGFNYLSLKDRAMTSSLMRVSTFEQALSHFKASYFSVALLINRETFIKDLEHFFKKEKWDGEAFLELMNKYQASPEMLYQRLTNIIPSFFGIHKLFILRIVHHLERDTIEIDKELHFSHKHHPHSNGLDEHYCRRWLSVSLLKDLQNIQSGGKYVGTIVGAQRSKFYGTNDEYLCITLARSNYPTPNRNVSVSIGMLINDELRDKVKFIDDSSIGLREVNKTCQRCPIQDCKERAFNPIVIEKKQARQRIDEALKSALERE